jgi:hypothetical protein
MNREDIIKLAREAGFEVYETDVWITDGWWLEELERFAALVAAAARAEENEACAKVCDVLAVHPEYASDITKVAAQAIRARGNK